MTATDWDSAATTTVEDYTPETPATLRLPITLYVGGQFIGGCDIVREMNASEIPRKSLAQTTALPHKRDRHVIPSN